MNKKDKLLKRFNELPKDFSFGEMEMLLKQFGFHLEHKGSTSGSRVIFVNESDGNRYIMHKPHLTNIIKGYVMKQVMIFLKVNNYIK